MFQDSLGELNKVRMSILEGVQAQPSPTAQNMGRQAMDALDTAALFLQVLGQFLESEEGRVEEVVKDGNLSVLKD